MQKKTAPTDIHWLMLNIYGDQTVDVSTMRWWVVHFSNGNSDVKEKPFPDGHTDFYEHGMQALVQCW